MKAQRNSHASGSLKFTWPPKAAAIRSASVGRIACSRPRRKRRACDRGGRRPPRSSAGRSQSSSRAIAPPTVRCGKYQMPYHGRLYGTESVSLEGTVVRVEYHMNYPVSTDLRLLPNSRNRGHFASSPSTSIDRPRGSCGHSILGCPDVNHHPGVGCLRGLLEQCALEVGLHYYHARASVTTRSSICVAPGAAGRARAIATSAAGCDQDWYRT